MTWDEMIAATLAASRVAGCNFILTADTIIELNGSPLTVSHACALLSKQLRDRGKTVPSFDNTITVTWTKPEGN